jgi:transposase-like protein
MTGKPSGITKERKKYSPQFKEQAVAENLLQ